MNHPGQHIHSAPPCKEQKAKYYRENKDRIRNRILKDLYNITLDEYNKMFNHQKGCCALCGIHQSEIKKTLAVDHNHRTGRVRELLCNRCNNGLGCFDDNVSLLRKAIKYLGKYDE